METKRRHKVMSFYLGEEVLFLSLYMIWVTVAAFSSLNPVSSVSGSGDLTRVSSLQSPVTECRSQGDNTHNTHNTGVRSSDKCQANKVGATIRHQI